MIQEELDRIMEELEEVRSSPLEYLPEYGYSYKDEVASILEDEIKRIKTEIEENTYDYTDDELENERTTICLQLGIPRFC